MRATKTVSIAIVFLLVACISFPSDRPSKKHPAGCEQRQEGIMMGPGSAFIEVAIDSGSGQFTMGVPNNGPIILFGHPNPWSSYATIKVDGNDYAQTNWTLKDPPKTVDLVNEGVWTLGGTGVEVHQIITLVKGLSTEKFDTYLLEWKLVNTTAQSHVVGCRMMFDTDLAGNDGAPFRVPGAGSIASEREWDSSHIPPYFFVFNSLSSPEVTAQGTLLGGFVSIPPTTFQIAYWGGIYDAPFDYVVDGKQAITSDSAYAVYWTEQTLAGNDNVAFDTYYGLGGISVDSSPPLVTTTLAPQFLECVNDIITPNPFEVSLYLENAATGVTGTVTGIEATLTVPAGLRIPAGSETQKLTDMKPDPNDSRLLSWSVIADGTVRGEIPYSITVSSSNHGTKVTKMKIKVPEGSNCKTGDLPPIIAIVAPSSSSTLQCQTTIESSAEDLGDPKGDVTQVQYFLDELPLGQPVTVPPGFKLSWNTLDVPNGEHLLTAKALDDTGNEGKSNKVFVDVENPIVSSVEYKASTKKLKLFGENLPEDATIVLNGAELDTSLGKKVSTLYTCSFDTMPGQWSVNGTVEGSSAEPDPLSGGGGNNALISYDSTMAHVVNAVGKENIKVAFDYAYYKMGLGEGCIVEYSTSGTAGPWTVGYSATSASQAYTSSGWKSAYFICPKEANNNSDLWIRFRNSVNTTHGDDNSQKFVRIDNVRVNSANYFLLAKKVPAIGHAQTLPIKVKFGSCETPVFWYTRP